MSVQIALTSIRSQYSVNFNDFQHRNQTSILVDQNNLQNEKDTKEHLVLKQFIAEDHEKLREELKNDLANNTLTASNIPPC